MARRRKTGKHTPDDPNSEKRDDYAFDAPLDPADLPAGTECIGPIRTYAFGEYWGQPKIIFDFEVVEPAKYAGLRIRAFLPHPGQRPPSRTSKFFRWWCLANGGPPQRGQRLAMKVFMQGYLHFTIRWGERNDEPTIPVVDQLLGRAAGGPR